MKVENLIEDLTAAHIIIYGQLLGKTDKVKGWIQFYTAIDVTVLAGRGAPAGPAGGSQRGAAAHGAREGPAPPPLPQQLQHRPRVPQGEEGKTFRFL